MKYLFYYLTLPGVLLWADFGIQDQFEFHSKYQNLAFELQDVVIYSRLEKAICLPKERQLYLRIEIPYAFLWGKEKELISLDEDGIVSPPERAKTRIIKKTAFKEQGVADLLTKIFFVIPIEGKNALFGFGSEFTFPTAQEPDLGVGKYAACPVAGMKWNFPHLGDGSSLALFAKYQFSIAGDSNRAPFQILHLQPVFAYAFKNNWVLVLSPEFQYNVREKKWFVPTAISLGKNFEKHFAISLSYQKGIVTDFPVFQDEVELVLRYIF